ncbi:MAG: type II toxin-antitoxin system HicA family toxin [Nitrosospira sp.]|nr:type II toxin-antitoxin system HicA family toxin [Nitrosospira sp.]
MRLPRDLSGAELVKRLDCLGYRVTRQTGSHIRLTCDHPDQHHVTIPNHNPLRVGTLSAIIVDIATHHSLDREELLRRLFD